MLLTMEPLTVSHRSVSFSDWIAPVPVSGVSTRRHSVSVLLQRAFKCVSLAAPSFVKDNAIMKFKEASRNGNLVPLQTCIFSDQLTPTLAYRCLVKEGDLEGPSFVFESVVPGSHDSTLGRYSVVGAQPCLEIVAKENKVITMDHEAGMRTEEMVEDPQVIPRRVAEGWKPQLTDELPDIFCGGWVGFSLYDMVRSKEKKELSFSKVPGNDRNLADIHLALYDDVIVFDHVEKKVHVIHWVRLDLHSSVEKAFVNGMKRLEILLSRVQGIDPPKLSPGSVESYIQGFGPSFSESNITSEAYKKEVVQAKQHILAGDIFQNGFSQQFERRTFADPFEVYRAFRVVNPSPFMTYLQARGCILVASSPEILTHVKKENARELTGGWEESRRGPYGGGVGIVSFTGDMEIASTLRTIVFPTGNRFDTLFSYKYAKQRQEWIAHCQAGTRIVADAVPEEKQRDCDSKAAALAHAIDLAEAAFVKK